MNLQPVLIAGSWRDSVDPVTSFHAYDPEHRRPLAEEYPVSALAEVVEALTAAEQAADQLGADSAEQIAQFLDRYAELIESQRDQLVEQAHVETALPKAPRLADVELPRTTSQLRQAAAAARARSWCHATLDVSNNIRAHFGPLGRPVVVFGPNNFPFAFNSVAGGDFAAAIAAGNPVIAKANTGHPGTTRQLAGAALTALKESGLPTAMVQMVYRTPADVGTALVAHPLTGATAFTGSKSAGLKLKAAADAAGKPIYLEMSSVNPVFLLEGALQERGDEIAQEFFTSCSLGAGQFCTNPGLVVVPEGELGEAFLDSVRRLFDTHPPGTLLGEKTRDGLEAAVEALQRQGAEMVTGGHGAATSRCCYANTLLRTSGAALCANPHALQAEAFGTAALVVFAASTAEMVEIAGVVEGSLTGCLYSQRGNDDEAAYRQIAAALRRNVGRLLNDKMPTGVAVSPAMNHGGPYPATGHPGFTAVGLPAAMLRFAALHCYDNVRPQRLPPELQDANPTGTMWRCIDGQWTQRSL
jgi:NADP-dependent aldehyde dehydrogenase